MVFLSQAVATRSFRIKETNPLENSQLEAKVKEVDGSDDFSGFQLGDFEVNQLFYIIFQGEKVKIFSQIPRVQLELADISSLYLFFGTSNIKELQVVLEFFRIKSGRNVSNNKQKPYKSVYEKSLTTTHINI